MATEKGNKLSKIPMLTKGQIAKLVIVTVINALITIGLIVGMIFLNGSEEGRLAFNEYFSNSSDKFIFLAVSVVFLSGIVAVYFYFENRAFVKEASNLEMIFLAMQITLIISFFVGKYLNVFLRPLILCAILLLPLTDRRTAIFTNIIMCVLVISVDFFINTTYANSYSIISIAILGLVCGTIGVYLMDKVYSRLHTVLRSLVLAIPSLVCITMVGGSITDNLMLFLYATLSHILATILMIVMLPIFEYLFNRITTYRLAETTRHDAPLIRKMIEIAPGTFNHSVLVSNVAEACATAIGEDALLARACAYYHDMGKLKQPEYFTENQKNGINPHDNLTPELSTSIIKMHTKDGYELIKKNHLPTIFADVCLQHHGTMPILYFFEKASKFTDGEIAFENFLHYGPKPQTKIAAIIMIADSAEAAVRTLTERTRAEVEKKVKGIVKERLELGQFDECDITMQELSIIEISIVNTLTGVYHERIEYPKISLESLRAKNETAEQEKVVEEQQTELKETTKEKKKKGDK